MGLLGGKDGRVCTYYAVGRGVRGDIKVLSEGKGGSKREQQPHRNECGDATEGYRGAHVAGSN